MTEQDTTTPVETPEVDAAEPLASSQDADAPKANKEARYRVERNQAREALATAQARIEQLHRLDVERLAGAHLSAPQDIWLSGNQADDYIGEGGYVDAERVHEDAKLLVSERPGLRKSQSAVDPSQGHGGSTPSRPTPTFGDLLSS
jgi:hypothetical protein